MRGLESLAFVGMVAIAVTVLAIGATLLLIPIGVFAIVMARRERVRP